MLNIGALIGLLEVYIDTFSQIKGNFNCLIETHEDYINDLKTVIVDIDAVTNDTKDTIRRLKEEKNDV